MRGFTTSRPGPIIMTGAFNFFICITTRAVSMISAWRWVHQRRITQRRMPTIFTKFGSVHSYSHSYLPHVPVRFLFSSSRHSDKSVVKYLTLSGNSSTSGKPQSTRRKFQTMHCQVRRTNRSHAHQTHSLHNSSLGHRPRLQHSGSSSH